jgi:acyl-coenzyme A synthetase/AMP-(fatty) acid ligase
MNAAERLLCVGADRSVALECGAERINYGALRDAVRCAGGAWQSLGLEAGGRVVILARDSIDWVVAYLGVIWAGGVAIGVNPRLPPADLAPILTDSEVRYVWCDMDEAAGCCALAGSLPAPPVVVANGGRDGIDWKSALGAATPIGPCERRDDDPALWIGTSGTTGVPKGVVHPQRVAAAPETFARDVLRAGRDDRFYSSSKLFFAYALANSLFAGLRLGATVILDRERASPERVLAMVERHRPTLVFTVPTLYNRMLLDRVAPALTGRGIRHFVSAGEALPASIRSGWMRAVGMAPISGYGTSETLCLVLYGDDDSGLLRPTPGTSMQFAVADPEMPQRIWVRNPTLALGYWRRPEAEADGFRDGWFSPGDVFIRREGADGRLEFAGRSDDMLKVSGQWVSTLWIEHALAEACGDSVEQVAAVGAPTPEGLISIAVLAVAAAGREDDARRRLAAGVERLPRYRRPSWVHWVSALPQTATGKLQRSRLRDTHDLALAHKEAR